MEFPHSQYIWEYKGGRLEAVSRDTGRSILPSSERESVKQLSTIMKITKAEELSSYLFMMKREGTRNTNAP